MELSIIKMAYPPDEGSFGVKNIIHVFSGIYAFFVAQDK